MIEKVFCVISHTHWDREWYLSFENFRIKLINLIDNLLEVLKQNDGYIFHLDAQTVILEDYFEINPHMKNTIYDYIKEGRILLGPWYVQNDFYLTSGESTIRNLLIGSKMAGKAGKCSRVGYVPDQFGLISQLPQIFNGFGINDCILGRGYNFFTKTGQKLQNKKSPSEFTWQGADGSNVFSVHMPFWYNNAQRFSSDREKSMRLLEEIEDSFTGVAGTPYLLLMNGVDHLEAQENLLPILKDLDNKLPKNKEIKQFSMDKYMDKVKGFIAGEGFKNKLETYTGEMRNGNDQMILQGTLSSRIYLKVLNSKAQNLIENILEPLYSMIWMAGAQKEYPAEFTSYLWKELIKNHAHDSICGCSCDEVHKSMEDRYRRFFLTADDLAGRAMDFISRHINRDKLKGSEYLITLFNTLEKERNSVLALNVMFPVEENISDFEILDTDGSAVPYIITGKKKAYMDMFTAINLPGTKEVDLYSIHLPVRKVPPIGFKSYLVKPGPGERTKEKKITDDADSPFELENDYIKATVYPDGKVDLHYKTTGIVYSDIITLEDTEDCGDSYVYSASPNSKIFTTKVLQPEIKSLIKSDLYSSCVIEYGFNLPDGYDEQTQKRREKLVLNKVEIILSLKEKQTWLDIDFTIDNRSENHRLRALVNTGINTDYTAALSPFDIIIRDKKEVLNGIKNGTQPNSGFVAIEDGQEGLALLNMGLYEYEHLIDKNGTIAMTLLRSNGIISSFSQGEQWKVPGNQCLRKIDVSMAIHPYKGDFVSAQITKILKEYQTPLSSYYQPVDLRKFSGGRAAVQDSNIEETFYRKDKYPAVIFDRENNFLEITGDEVVITAIKKSSLEESIIIRLFNTSDQETKFSLKYFKEINRLTKVKLDESKERSIVFNGKSSENIIIGSKEILTLSLS